jgi:hypothetical protein
MARKNKKIEPIPGYDPKNYDRKKGIDPTGIDIVSNKVVEQAADLLIAGYAEATVRDILYETYPSLNSYMTKFIIGRAHTHIYEDVEKQTDDLLKKQNIRLFRLYRMALDDNDKKAALQILSEINKLNKLYTTKIEVTSDVFTLDLGIETKDENTDKED